MDVTITNLDGFSERVRLPNASEYVADDAHYREEWTGVVVTGIWTGPRSGRRFLRTHSIWQNRKTHGIVGTVYEEVDEERYLSLCDKVGIEPTNVTPTEV